MEPDEPTRPLYDDHLAIVDRRTSGPGSVVSGVKVTFPAGHRPPQPRKAEPAIGLRSRMVSLHPHVFLHSVCGTTPRCALMVAINFGWTPSNRAYGSCPLGPLHRDGPARHPFFCGDCADVEEVLIAAINAIIKQKIGRTRSLLFDFVVGMRIPAGRYLDAAAPNRGHRRVVLVGAISAKIASYDQPRHPE